MTNTTKGMLRAMVPGAAVGLALRFVPDPAGEWIARALALATCGALLALTWWAWQSARALPSLDALADSMRVNTTRLRDAADERDRWHAETLAIHRKAREHFAAAGNREVVALYDRLIAGMEGRSHDGAVN